MAAAAGEDDAGVGCETVLEEVRHEEAAEDVCCVDGVEAFVVEAPGPCGDVWNASVVHEHVDSIAAAAIASKPFFAECAHAVHIAHVDFPAEHLSGFCGRLVAIHGLARIVAQLRLDKRHRCVSSFLIPACQTHGGALLCQSESNEQADSAVGARDNGCLPAEVSLWWLLRRVETREPDVEEGSQHAVEEREVQCYRSHGSAATGCLFRFLALAELDVVDLDLNGVTERTTPKCAETTGFVAIAAKWGTTLVMIDSMEKNV